METLFGVFSRSGHWLRIFRAQHRVRHLPPITSTAPTPSPINNLIVHLLRSPLVTCFPRLTLVSACFVFLI